MNYIPGSCVHNFAASIGLGGLRDPKLSKPTIKNSIRTPSLGNNHISPTIYLGTFESSMIFPTSLFGGICFLVSWGGRVSAFFFLLRLKKEWPNTNQQQNWCLLHLHRIAIHSRHGFHVGESAVKSKRSVRPAVGGLFTVVTVWWSRVERFANSKWWIQWTHHPPRPLTFSSRMGVGNFWKNPQVGRPRESFTNLSKKWGDFPTDTQSLTTGLAIWKKKMLGPSPGWSFPFDKFGDELFSTSRGWKKVLTVPWAAKNH